MVKLITLEDGRVLNLYNTAFVGAKVGKLSSAEVGTSSGPIRVSLSDRERIIEALREMEAACSRDVSVETGSPKITIAAGRSAERVMERVIQDAALCVL